MGGGASKGYRLEAGNGQSAGPRPDWLQDPSKKLAPLSQNKFENLMGVGKGKFGFVYCAKHASKKCVAIKYISKSFIHECKSIARINQEIALVQKIDHPYMVHCFGGFDTSECIALVFDYCMGGEFFTYLKKQTKISEGYAKFYFCEIALAISYLHETLGYVYRDLKPENILLDYDGHVRICDFGFAVRILLYYCSSFFSCS
jgi:serine/threonine protein kinase